MTLDPRELAVAVGGARRRLQDLNLSDQAIRACVVGLARMETVLARPPRVAILGEVNSGKTSVADLLLGMGLLPASVVANTRLPVLIRHGETPALYGVDENNGIRRLTNEDFEVLPGGMAFKALEIELPIDRLAEFEILDTPALGDQFSRVATGDIHILCTVAPRAWTESERAFWSSLPAGKWRNALLVATHRDALEHVADAAKVEARLRAAAGHMFRDIILVSATDANQSRRTNGRPSDAGVVTMLAQVRVWAAEIRARRARNVERIVRRLARLTFHQLARGVLRAPEARILREWDADVNALLARLGRAPDDLPYVLQQMLFRFARAMEQARPGAITRENVRPAEVGGVLRPAPMRRAAVRRYARLVASDLTALLRIELARTGCDDESRFAGYDAARAILLPLARLDRVLADVEVQISLAKEAPSRPLSNFGFHSQAGAAG